MKPLHKIIMVGTTFVLAAATGHVMQNPAQFGLQSRATGAEVAPLREVENVQSVANIDPSVQVSGLSIEGVPELPTAPLPRLSVADGAIGQMPSDPNTVSTGFAAALDGAPPVPEATTCAEPELQWLEGASATVLLTLSAPCLPGQTAMLRHEGLDMPIQLSDQGAWSGPVPALAREARIAVALPDGMVLEVAQTVSGLEKLNRVALFGTAPPLALHGLEYGSAFDEVGDVHPLAPRAADTTLGGWMASFTVPGAAPYAQIYTAPADLTDLRLEVEAEVSPALCGQDAQASVQRLLGGKAEVPAALSIALPDCDDATGSVMMRLPDFPLAVALN